MAWAEVVVAALLQRTSKTLISRHAANFEWSPSDPCGGMMGDNGQAVMHRINVQILLHQTEPTRHLFFSASLGSGLLF